MTRDSSRSGKIVSLSSGALATTSLAVRQVEAYWQALRDGKLVPARSDIDPRGLENALDVTFIAERIAPGTARMRIAGYHYSDLLGMEARGMTLGAMFLPESRAQITDAIEQCCDDPAQVTLSIKAPGTMGAPEIEGQLLLLPLRSDLGDISRIMGVITTTGQIGRTPRRFVVTGSQMSTLTSGVARVDLTPSAPVPNKTVGFADPSAAFEGPKTRPSKVPHLRVVEG